MPYSSYATPEGGTHEVHTTLVWPHRGSDRTGCLWRSGNGADGPRFGGALSRREGAIRGRQEGRHGGELRYGPDVRQLGGGIRGGQEALSRGRDRLQRHRVGGYRRATRQ